MHRFDYRGKAFEFRLQRDGSMQLCLDGVVRKQRQPAGKEPVYLWTNVELQWEEHHFIEARYWVGSGRLVITANGQALHDDQF